MQCTLHSNMSDTSTSAEGELNRTELFELNPIQHFLNLAQSAQQTACYDPADCVWCANKNTHDQLSADAAVYLCTSTCEGR